MKSKIKLLSIIAFLGLISCVKHIDYDLTKLTPNAQIEQLMDIYENGNNYLDKTIRVSGIYQYSLYSDKKYDLCTLCDSQGNYNYSIEFVSDRNINFDKDEKIYVEGILEEYNEGSNKYIRIKNARVTKN